MTRMSVVIPNWNGAAFIGSTLDALAAQHRTPDEVVVVDNASTDESCAVIAAHPLATRIVVMPTNLGFAGGANAGIEACAGDLVVVLNSDARPRPEWLATLAQAVENSDRDVWAWGSVLVAPDGLIESAGDAWHDRGQAYKLNKGDRIESLPSEPYDVFAAPGAAPMFRRDVFLDLGGFEPRFFMYYEDIDLAMRARLNGWRAVVVPTAIVEHDLGRSSSSATQLRRVRYLIARNSLWTVLRGPAIRPRVIARTTRKELQTARRDGYARAYLLGRLAGIAGAPRCLLERKRLRSLRRPDAKGVLV